MTGRRTAVAAGFGIALAASTAAMAEYRHALVIGNSAYPTNAGSAPLSSPPHDVKLVGDALEKRGFVVTRLENVGADLPQKLGDFGRSVPIRGTALVYFSGYAVPSVQPGNPKHVPDNALVRVDGQADVTVRHAIALVNAASTNRFEARSGSATHIVIVDGCYARPGQKPPPGLVASGTLAPDSLVIYAAGFGEVLEPPAEGASPLARSFAADLASPKPLDEILASLGGAREWSLGDHAFQGFQGDPQHVFPVTWPTAPKRSLRESLAFLAAPASVTPASPPTALAPGTRAGEEWVSPLGMVFCWCPPGSARIGSDASSPGHQSDETVVEVEIPEGFWISKYEFTRRDVFVLNNGHAYLSTGVHKLQPFNNAENDPIPFRPWKEGDGRNSAASFLIKLNGGLPAPTPPTTTPPKAGPPLPPPPPAGWVYDLPTEAEWEYAARAGTATAYWFGDDPAVLARYGNFADRSLRESTALPERSSGNPPRGPAGRAVTSFRDEQSGLYSHAHKTWDDGNPVMALVGSYPPNPWGLHDVHGNISEVTSTTYHPAREPIPPDTKTAGLRAVSKGGSWQSYPEYCRSAFRSRKTPDPTENIDGFRIVLRRGPETAKQPP